MTTCRNCETELTPAASFCDKCGQVVFADENLEAAVREELEKPEEPLKKGVIRELRRILVPFDDELNDEDRVMIFDLQGLNFAVNLNWLIIEAAQISDVSPLASLTNLTRLNLGGNQVSDISPLASLTNLIKLSLHYNEISDVSPLASLTNLTELVIWGNQITDVGPPAHCSDCLRGLAEGQEYCPRCGGEREATAASFPKLAYLWLDVDQLIDKSQLASLPNLRRLNGSPFVREDFISTETVESSEDSEDTESKESFRDAETLDWEILPPGFWREKDSSMMNQLRSQFKTKKEFRDFIDRLEFVDSYGPIKTVKTKFSGQGYQYFVFLFRNHAVAECPQYGNAVYVLTGTDGWQSIFKKSRQELRKNFSNRVTWIRHSKTWKQRLVKYLN